jgi:hypothetical protein
MSDYNVTLVVDGFKLDPEKEDDFFRLLEHFQGVDMYKLENNPDYDFRLYHQGTGYVFEVIEDEDHEGDELLDMGLYDLPKFIQYFMADGEEVILKDVGNLSSYEAYGYSAKITKDDIEDIHLHG